MSVLENFVGCRVVENFGAKMSSFFSFVSRDMRLGQPKVIEIVIDDPRQAWPGHLFTCALTMTNF